MERAIESFMKYQSDAEEKFMKWEEERWAKEMEEIRRREDREHEMRLLGQMSKPWESHYATNYPPSPYSEY